MTSNASQTDKEEDDEAVLLHLIKSDTGLVYSWGINVPTQTIMLHYYDIHIINMVPSYTLNTHNTDTGVKWLIILSVIVMSLQQDVKKLGLYCWLLGEMAQILDFLCRIL